jgi:cytochrome c-type biogenesis protein CcmH/NrfG
LENANRAVQEKADFGKACVLLGRVYLQRGDKRMALEALQQATRLLPSDPSPYYMLARLYADLGAPAMAEKARKTFESLMSEQQKESELANQ